jgi:hypothetical protein
MGLLEIDFFQEHVLKQGDQSNESALEQAKDKQIADAIGMLLESPRIQSLRLRFVRCVLEIRRTC